MNEIEEIKAEVYEALTRYLGAYAGVFANVIGRLYIAYDTKIEALEEKIRQLENNAP
jgi:hypothetical protein